MAGRNKRLIRGNSGRQIKTGNATRLIVLVLAILVSLSCSGPVIKKAEQPRGVYHRVKKGETLWAISRAYRIDLQEIAELNNITNPSSITEDSVVFIPGADLVVDVPVHREKKPPREKVKTAPVKPVKKENEKYPAAEAEKKPPEKTAEPAVKEPVVNVQPEASPARHEQDKIIIDRSRFIWPMKGTLAAKFGIQPNGLKYNGIRISAREGTPVVASAAGEVIHASPIKYYGETIIIKHDGHYSTVYTFLKSKKVKVGDRVRKGERIALLSRPENGNGKPYLNFEIRQNNKPRNPLFLLPEIGEGSR